MTRSVAAAAFALAAWPILCADAALACATARTGATCVRVLDSLAVAVPSRPAHVERVAVSSSSSAASPSVQVGDVLQRGEHSLILNADYYGLPAVSDGWVYMRIGQDAYRVDWHTHQVLERVTEEAAANF